MNEQSRQVEWLLYVVIVHEVELVGLCVSKSSVSYNEGHCTLLTIQRGCIAMRLLAYSPAHVETAKTVTTTCIKGWFDQRSEQAWSPSLQWHALEMCISAPLRCMIAHVTTYLLFCFIARSFRIVSMIVLLQSCTCFGSYAVTWSVTVLMPYKVRCGSASRNSNGALGWIRDRTES